MDSRTEKNLFWRILLTEVVLVLIIITPVFIVHRCDDWTGFCKDTTTEVSIEKNAKGQIQKRTDITKYQSGKTLWDWLGLFAVPVLLVILGYLFQRRDAERAEKQAKAEKEQAENQAELESEIASANLREDALQAYLDRMAELLLNPQYRKELIPREGEDQKSDNSVRDVARIRTVTIIRRLERDKERQATVLHFLRDAEMLNFLFKNANLEGVDLEGANLRRADLTGANLMGVNLRNALMVEAKLQGANLYKANLMGANLDRAHLEKANLIEANLVGALLVAAHLQEAQLWGAVLMAAYLQRAELWGAVLNEAILVGAFCTADQIKLARNWEKAYYSPDFRKELGLPPEMSEAKKDNS